MNEKNLKEEQFQVLLLEAWIFQDFNLIQFI